MGAVGHGRDSGDPAAGIDSGELIANLQTWLYKADPPAEPGTGINRGKRGDYDVLLTEFIVNEKKD